MSEELTLLPLPCPACGHPAGIARANGTGCAFVMCQHVKCAFSGPIKTTSEAAIAAWNALPRALTWTNEPPKVPGWYWNRDTRHPNEAGFLLVSNSRIEQLQRMSKPTEQWAGPIPEPRETKKWIAIKNAEEPCPKN